MIHAILVTTGFARLASSVAVTPNDKLAARAYSAAEPPCPYNVTAFIYRGCYNDTSPRVLLCSPTELDSSKMTPQYCQAACKSNNFKVSGREYYHGEILRGNNVMLIANNV